MAAGDIGSEIQTLSFETHECQFPEIVHVSGDTYAMVYRSALSPYGHLQTFTISSDGVIALVDSLEFDTVAQAAIRIIHTHGDVYAIVYSGPGTDGWLRTVGIQSDGTITGSIASFEFDTTQGTNHAIIHVSGDVYLIVYLGSLGIGSRGYIRTVRISDDGTTIQSISPKVEVSTYLRFPEILHVSGDVFAYVFGDTDAGIIETRKIYSDGSIEAFPESTFTFDVYMNKQTIDLSFIHISGDVFAVAYCGAPYASGHGWLKTVGVQSDGTITGEIDSLEFDTDQGAFPSIVHVANDAYMIAYMGYAGGGVRRGVYISIEISPGGTIRNIIDTKIFDVLHNERYQDLMHVSGDVYVCAYEVVGTDDGWLRTFGVDTPAEAARHRFTGGIQHRALH